MMHEQLTILDELSKLFYSSIQQDFDFAEIEYSFNKQEKWFSLSAYCQKAQKKFPPIDFENLHDKAVSLCEMLHDLMKDHTDGNWQKFVLSIDENREVRTQFFYETQSVFDEQA